MNLSDYTEKVTKGQYTHEDVTYLLSHCELMESRVVVLEAENALLRSNTPMPECLATAYRERDESRARLESLKQGLRDLIVKCTQHIDDISQLHKMTEKTKPCCDRDYDRDGNCDRHPRGHRGMNGG